MSVSEQRVAEVLGTHSASSGVVVSSDETEGLVSCECGWDETTWVVTGECACFDELNDDDYLTDCTCEFGRLTDQTEETSRDLARDLVNAHLAQALGRLPGLTDDIAFAVLDTQARDPDAAADPETVTEALLKATAAMGTTDTTRYAVRLAEIRSRTPLRSAQPEHAKVTADDPTADFDLDALDAAIRSRLEEWTTVFVEDDHDYGRITLAKPGNSSIPAMTILRDRRGIGRLLIESDVLILNDESDRRAATAAAEAAGFTVRHPIGAPDRAGFNGKAVAIGAWGNILGFEIGTGVLVALVDLDTEELRYVSDELRPTLLTRLERMGVRVQTIHVPTPTYKRIDECTSRHEILNSRLTWFYPYAKEDLAAIDPRYAVPEDAPLRIEEQVAAELPSDVVAAFEERLRGEIFDPMPKRNGRRTQPWERTNGVLNNSDIATYRSLAPSEVILPDDWESWWDLAADLSRPHAPVICALFLAMDHWDWWSSLTLDPAAEEGMRLAGDYLALPASLRAGRMQDDERRLQAAVALVVAAVPDLDGLREESHIEVECLLCGRWYELGMLQAATVYERLSVNICDRCGEVDWPNTERDLTPVQRAGITAAIRWYSAVAGHTLSAKNYENLETPFDVSIEASFVMERRLPEYVLRNWRKWVTWSKTN